ISRQSEYFFCLDAALGKPTVPIFLNTFRIVSLDRVNDSDVAWRHHVHLRLASRHVGRISDFVVVASHAVSHKVDIPGDDFAAISKRRKFGLANGRNAQQLRDVLELVVAAAPLEKGLRERFAGRATSVSRGPGEGCVPMSCDDPFGMRWEVAKHSG